ARAALFVPVCGVLLGSCAPACRASGPSAREQRVVGERREPTRGAKKWTGTVGFEPRSFRSLCSLLSLIRISFRAGSLPSVAARARWDSNPRPSDVFPGTNATGIEVRRSIRAELRALG